MGTRADVLQRRITAEYTLCNEGSSLFLLMSFACCIQKNMTLSKQIFNVHALFLHKLIALLLTPFHNANFIEVLQIAYGRERSCKSHMEETVAVGMRLEYSQSRDVLSIAEGICHYARPLPMHDLL